MWRKTNEKAADRRRRKKTQNGTYRILRAERLGLRYEDISEDGNWLHIQRTYNYEVGDIIDHTKGVDGDRIMPLTKKARQIICLTREKREVLSEDCYVFSMSNEPLPYHAIQYLFKHYCERLGTVYKSSHKARKTFISTLIDEGININTIREYVGHADERTTFHNYCFDRKSEEEKLELFERAMTSK